MIHELEKPNYNAWKINEKDFPSNGSIEDKIRFLIGYGVLAPSTHNTQPWQFSVTLNLLTILPDLQYKLPEADINGRNLYISLGACFYNIEVAANYFGLKANTQMIDRKNDTVIEMLFSESAKAPQARTKSLFKAIPKRYSEKRTVDPIKLSADDWSHLKIPMPADVTLSFADQKLVIKQIADDVFQAAAGYSDIPRFGQELAVWMRSNNTKHNDGMTGRASGLTTGKVVVGKMLMKHVPKSMRMFAKKYHEQTIKSSGLGLISTSYDSPKSWISAGKVYEELALTATSGISLGPMAAMIETNYRQKLPNYFGDAKQYPQMFFRLIKSKNQAAHSPRRNPGKSILGVSKQSAEVLQASIATDTTSKFIKISNFNVHYVVAGKGEPVLLIHGANMGWGQWHPNIASLANSYQVYAIDLPGSGKSTRFDYRKADFKKDYVDVVAHFITMQKLDPVKVIGHSFGGAIAARLAIDYPQLVESLVLTNPLGLTTKVPLKQRAVSSKKFATFISRTAMKPTRKNMESFLKSAMHNKDALTDPFIDYYHQMVKQDKRSHPLLFMHGQTRGFHFNPAMLYQRSLGKIKQPVMIILGENDPLLPIPAIAAMVRVHKDVKLKMFEQTGHVPALEQSDLFNKEVLNFFKN